MTAIPGAPGHCTRRPGSRWTKCRCTRCRRRNSLERKRLATEIELGRRAPSRSDEAIERLAELLDLGWTPTLIARAAGLEPSTVQTAARKLRAGAPLTLYTKTAAAILDVTAPPEHGKVDASGSRRRLQALASMGWSLLDLLPRCTLSHSGLSCVRAGKVNRVGAPHAREIAALYDVLWDQVGPSPRAMLEASRRGWAAPLAWDDATIDDPAARPAGKGWRPGHLDIKDWAALVAAGEHPARAAARFGVGLSAVARAAYRAHRPDIAVLAERAEAA